MRKGLASIRVLDFSDQIAGPYSSKLLVDGGAEVIKVESPEGDSLRRWSATGADLHGEDSALFSFLNAGKQSVVGAAADPHVAALLARADLVIEAHGLESDTGERLDVAGLFASHPSLVVLSDIANSPLELLIFVSAVPGGECTSCAPPYRTLSI